MLPKKRHCADTSQGNTLLGWLGHQGTEGEVHESVRVAQPTQQKNDDRPVAAVKLKVYKFQENWQSGQDWLMFDKDHNVMFCDVCQKFDKLKKPNSSACRFVLVQVIIFGCMHRVHIDSLENFEPCI